MKKINAAKKQKKMKKEKEKTYSLTESELMDILSMIDQVQERVNALEESEKAFHKKIEGWLELLKKNSPQTDKNSFDPLWAPYPYHYYPPLTEHLSDPKWNDPKWQITSSAEK
jgi:hypothetical protein